MKRTSRETPNHDRYENLKAIEFWTRKFQSHSSQQYHWHHFLGLVHQVSPHTNSIFENFVKIFESRFIEFSTPCSINRNLISLMRIIAETFRPDNYILDFCIPHFHILNLSNRYNFIN
ncbi:hypothetical protein BpHYR1_005545 [Brachionus plicatilis]|uniref:Uncharacterized protein n=1 Tax=Brachionus plicatilis TaxID=10195 RepID=A0A3M7SGL1_BRAPC|nr:hypothetical protein BpHYR1_005545 [Brachionus plicatilis]